MSATTQHIESMAGAIDEAFREMSRTTGIPRGLREAMDRARAKAVAARKWAAAQGSVQRDLFGGATEKDANPAGYSDSDTSLRAAHSTISSGRAKVNLFRVLAFLEVAPRMNDEICVALEREDREKGREVRPWQSTICSRLNAAEQKGFACRPGDEGRTRTGTAAKRYHLTPRGREALAEWRATR